MKINFDVTSLVRENLTGIGVYTKNLIQAIQQFPGIECTGTYRLSRFKKRKLIELHASLPVKPYLPVISGYLPASYDIFHGPDFRIPVGHSFKKVVTIHDMVVFQRELVDEKFSQAGMAKMKRMLSRGKPDHIMVDSAFTQSEFLKHFPEWESQTTVVHLGMDHIRIQTEKLPAIYDFPYVIFVGTVEKRKNVSRIIEAFAQVSPAYPDLRLLIIGGKGMLSGPIFNELEANPAKDKIIYKGFVTENELIALYQHALFTLYPSMYEGFGIPILESMRLSCPVLTSNIGSMAEVSGQAALHVNPFDVEDITAGMIQLLENPTLRQQLVESGHERVKQFTWQACAENTIQVYKQVLSDK
ncbi:glycosyltransferase family 4 protein [Rhodocytophaga rosea]|uniref:Glycosyltransferase family 4 protein n=1 Tax=Rhodocytophaga rosea TaxID=2704465 RepID=A0A6C0GQP9_9BACT|nr:glycosyltransferase family 1 protein [Rhodocytophaga rosea]QHT69892.1 glycosyltransferase family 4 protein [Rhodocytophaga rosea]